MRQIFMLRQKLAGKSRIKEALELNDVAIGWCRAEQLLKASADPVLFKKTIASLYPEFSAQQIGRGVSETLRFLDEVRSGDILIVPDNRDIYFCTAGELFYHNEGFDNDSAIRRRVVWLNGKKPVSRHLLSNNLQRHLSKRYPPIKLLTNTLPEVLDICGEAEREEIAARREELLKRDGSIVLTETRPNQSLFRDYIFRTYDGICCVTGSQVDSVLDAAHVTPYNTGHSDRDHLDNGLLLRKDIHRLFDLVLLSIDPDNGNNIAVSKTLSRTEYAHYNGRRAESHASPQRLRAHYSEFVKQEGSR